MITKPLDRITEAYNGDMGEDFGKKTRNRINWIVNHTKGKEILDVGCSQGIVPIILGREGKIVDALDIAQESIDYAKEKLANEHNSVQENIHFRVSNFMTDDQIKPEYETILLTEVLEHISDTDIFLRKIYDHLAIEGRLVATVPFGINDYFDHKRTYYFLELNEHLAKYFSIEKIEFLGKWTGVICKKKDMAQLSQETLFKREVIEELEKAFYIVERELLTRVENFQISMKEKNENIKNIQNQHNQYIEKLKEQLLERDNQIKTFNGRISEFKLLEGKRQVVIEEEKEINRKLLQQIENQNREASSFFESVENHTRRYLEKFEEQIFESKTVNENLKQELNQYQSQVKKYIEEIKDKNESIEILNNKYVELRFKEEKLINECKELSNRIDDLDVTNSILLKELESERKEKDALIEQFNDQNKEHFIALQEEYDRLTKQFLLFKEKTFSSLCDYNNLFGLLDTEIEKGKTLKEEINIEKQKNKEYENTTAKLIKENEILSRRLHSYKNSKLGRITTLYWQFRKKVTKGVKQR